MKRRVISLVILAVLLGIIYVLLFRPTVYVLYVLPNDFKGAFKLVLNERSEGEIEKEKGIYVVRIPKDGRLVVKSCDFLTNWHKDGAKYENGEVIKELKDGIASDSKIKLFDLGASTVNQGEDRDKVQFWYFVGTKEEFEKYDKTAMDRKLGRVEN